MITFGTLFTLALACPIALVATAQAEPPTATESTVMTMGGFTWPKRSASPDTPTVYPGEYSSMSHGHMNMSGHHGMNMTGHPHHNCIGTNMSQGHMNMTGHHGMNMTGHSHHNCTETVHHHHNCTEVGHHHYQNGTGMHHHHHNCTEMRHRPHNSTSHLPHLNTTRPYDKRSEPTMEAAGNNIHLAIAIGIASAAFLAIIVFTIVWTFCQRRKARKGRYSDAEASQKHFARPSIPLGQVPAPVCKDQPPRVEEMMRYARVDGKMQEVDLGDVGRC